MSTILHWRAAEYVVARLQEGGFEGYIVGGAVRDILLGYPPKDFDIVTNATPEEVTEIKGFLQANYKDTAQAYGVSRVVVVVEGINVEIEVATYRKDIEAHLGRKLTKVSFTHIEDDLERRDFTINALALDPHNDFLVDLHNGLKDLDAKQIRFIGDAQTRIHEDPLRILRAVRFRARLGFDYEHGTRVAMIESIKAGKVREIAVDRVRHELTSMLLHRSRKKAFEDLDQFGVLLQILPELSACRGVMQPPDHHAEGDVWQHTLLTIHALPEYASVRLAWAALLHDIGKVPTFRTPEAPSDRIRFDGHYRVGAELANAILQRLRFSNRVRQDIVWLVHNHLITDSFPAMKLSRQHYYMQHPAFHDLLALHAADVKGSIAMHPERKHIEPELQKLQKQWDDYKRRSLVTPLTIKQQLGIDGNWIKKQYNLTDGPVLGMLLKELNRAFVDGEVRTRTDARMLVNDLLSKH